MKRTSLAALSLLCFASSAEAQAPEVKMFGASWCGPCRAVKSFLEKNRVPFDYRDIDVPQNRAEFQRVGGGGGIPLLFVGREKVLGANLPQITILLERAKLLKAVPPEGKEGVDLFGGHRPEWWQEQFRDLRAHAATLGGKVAEFAKVAADQEDKELLERMKEDLKIVQATLDALDNDASKVGLPRKYRE